ncbi:hypothetical protein Q9Q94_10195 [Uliginosibacterium sp. 31-16]|uniref:hypothetical protein n=1 Tax=Uliginosibacterium sp. 31-16 TaxID=3068315 RepID=UPI00273E2B7C|nr:hypothetical protein [Uliginosibacterium sp. 31-16]MDP5239905.1 hypothetical protein [Uliginosibacterium sp. 31-16]
MSLEATLQQVDKQIADEKTDPVVKEALIASRAKVIRAHIKTLMDEVKAARALLPKPVKKEPAPKPAKK